MPRTKRIPGETGWSHIIFRGINRENLFYDEEDFERFQVVTLRYLRECDLRFSVICLMSNHVHLLLWEREGRFSEAMKKIAVSYAQYYNKKLDRVGPVFQDRYRSEPVNDERYFLTVTRYIWQNPEKAGICPAGQYRHTLLDESSLVPAYFPDEKALLAWLQEPSDEECLEYRGAAHMADADAIALIAQLADGAGPQAVQGMGRAQRDAILRRLKADGASVRTISRLTGLNRNIVQRA